QIEALFVRHPALWGFSIRGLSDVPDSCPRRSEEELFVGDVGISPALSAEQFGEIFQEIATALGELLSEEPELSESLRGRTFARTLH
ncbi:MAG: hypothetical protein ACREUC_11265, partial [Steroidobacteraceae bacterium]